MNNRGQNTVEYLMLVIAVVTVMIAFLAPNGKYQKAMQNAMNESTFKAIEKANAEIVF